MKLDEWMTKMTHEMTLHIAKYFTRESVPESEKLLNHECRWWSVFFHFFNFHIFWVCAVLVICLMPCGFYAFSFTQTSPPLNSLHKKCMWCFISQYVNICTFIWCPSCVQPAFFHNVLSAWNGFLTYFIIFMQWLTVALHTLDSAVLNVCLPDWQSHGSSQAV